GNFKTYLWVWAQFAEEHGYIIVAPSYGFGNWDRELGVTAVQATLADAVQKANIDPNRVILAGLSNGGFGATRVAEQFPDAYQGVILLSPGIDGQSIDNQAYAEGWNGRSHLIITGEQDKRIPVGYVNGRSQQLQNIGVDVTLHTFPKEDHFLFYSQPDDVMHLIAEWLE
ncbi:MAG: prolyl oligopeptidase family serine peptidase, partial [Chloroflexota bacterium]